jgi:UDP-GlcNAc:undecaprenyl-phosphate/decaprenyl-phosphate GlcNAc-1-phosphate transferase
MNTYYLQMTTALTVSLVLSLLSIPRVIAISMKFDLVDQPSARKVHLHAISRLGGIAIFFSAFAGIVISRIGLDAVRFWPVLFSSIALVFLLGVWDDLTELNAKLRFIIQVCLAISLASTGIRLSSLYGILGIHELSVSWQYIVTVLIIVGATNAFNLIDGVDGLAGGLGLIGMLVLGTLSWTLRLYPLVIVLAACIGALIGFLKYNSSPARIFMGDGGSLVLGFLLSSIGILLIEKAHAAPGLIEPSKAAILVTAILIIPVFDTWRVFASRIRTGVSPFKADKTHLHHLFLIAGLNHRKTAFALYFFEILLILLALLFSNFKGVSIIILLMVGIPHALTLVLRINKGMEKWLAIIRKMELE